MRRSGLRTRVTCLLLVPLCGLLLPLHLGSVDCDMPEARGGCDGELCVCPPRCPLHGDAASDHHADAEHGQAPATAATETPAAAERCTYRGFCVDPDPADVGFALFATELPPLPALRLVLPPAGDAGAGNAVEPLESLRAPPSPPPRG